MEPAMPAEQDFRESHLRSVLKAFSWRVVATLTTAAIAYAITGEIETAIMIGSVEFVLKLFIYYAHERAWQVLPRGAIRAAFHLKSRVKSRSATPTNPR
jgi:uncharacterized membrane protein